MKNVNVEIKANGEIVVTSNTGRIIPNVTVTGQDLIGTQEMQALASVNARLEEQLNVLPQQIQAKLQSSLTMGMVQQNLGVIYEGIHYISENQAYDKLPALQRRVESVVASLKEMKVWNSYHQTDAELKADKRLAAAESNAQSIKDKKAERSEAEKKQQQTTKEEKDMNKTVNKKGFDAVTTGGKMFTNIKGIKTGEVRRAVQFTTAKGQDVVIGFAKDRNAFMEAVGGIIKEVSRTDVLKRLAKYEGKDAKYLTKMVKELRPVTMAAGTCSCCGTEVSNSVKEYSNRVYGVTLCRPCQKDFGGKVKAEQQKQQQKAANESEPQQNQEHSVPGLSFQKDACECGNEKMVEMNMCDTCADREYYARMDAQMEEWDRDMNDGLSDVQEDALPEVFNQESNRETSSEHQSPNSHNAGAEEKQHNVEASEKPHNVEVEQNEAEYVNPVNVEFDSSELV
jgi:hypothetical protein